MIIAVGGFCTVALSIFGLRQNKIRFSDSVLFNAARCFSRFSSKNMRLNDVNCVHVFSDFACGFLLWSKFFLFCRFLLLIVRFCGFFYIPMPPSYNILTSSLLTLKLKPVPPSEVLYSNPPSCFYVLSLACHFNGLPFILFQRNISYSFSKWTKLNFIYNTSNKLIQNKFWIINKSFE